MMAPFLSRDQSTQHTSRSNPTRVVRVKEVALLRRLLTTVLTVAVVTMMIVVAMAMALFADEPKER